MLTAFEIIAERWKMIPTFKCEINHLNLRWKISLVCKYFRFYGKVLRSFTCFAVKTQFSFKLLVIFIIRISHVWNNNQLRLKLCLIELFGSKKVCLSQSRFVFQSIFSRCCRFVLSALRLEKFGVKKVAKIYLFR